MYYVVALDLGTTSIKAMVFDLEGCICGEAAQEETLLFPDDHQIEQSPHAWYETAATVICDAVEHAGIERKLVRAIGISSQGISVVPVDRNFIPIRNAICWLDTRAKTECNCIEEALDKERIYDVTGKFLLPAYTMPKLLWLKRNEPDVYLRADKFLLPMDYAIARFTGKALTDHSMAAGTMLYDIKQASWSEELLSILSLNKEKLPEIRWSGTVAGTLLPEAAERCGLTTDVLVMVGGQDQKVAAFGANLVEGSATISMGTAGAFEFLLNAPMLHPERSLPTFPYVRRNNWVMEGCINTAGAAIKWVKNTVFSEVTYKEMNDLAKCSAQGAGGVLFYPYLTAPGTPHKGEYWAGGYMPLTLKTSRADMARALYEGLSYESRLNLDAAERAGVAVGRLSIFGGGSKSQIFCDILAHVTGKTIRSYQCAEFGCIGAASLAIEGMGLDLAAFTERHLSAFEDHIPEFKLHNFYNDEYNRYINCLHSQNR
ncbi:MAG: FGGY family carbohydrate kinase [Clostridia bacterium]